MKKIFFINMVLFFIVSNTNGSFSDEKKYNHEIEFGDTTAERILQFNGNGKINITGYDGNKILLSSNENIFKGENSKANEKAKGLTKIGSGGFNIINNKQKNIIIISRMINRDLDLDVKVPNHITLKFGNEINNQVSVGKLDRLKLELREFEKQLSEKAKETSNIDLEIKKLKEEISRNEEEMQDISIPQTPQKINTPLSVASVIVSTNGIFMGDISIKNFSGTIEASIEKGNITAENIDGHIIASTVNGDINITFRKINKDKTLYFTTVNGDIDITFPKDINAYIMSSAAQGDIYSGFAGDVVIGDESADERGRIGSQSPTYFHPVTFIITSKINNGGQKIYLNTMDGNIYIRKGS